MNGDFAHAAGAGTGLLPPPARQLPAVPRPPSSRVALPGGEWALWRTLCVRGAGFAAEHVLRLAAPEAARRADDLLAEEARGAGAGALRSELTRAFDEDTRRARAALRELARDPRLREAVTWQNPQALRLGFDVLARKPLEASDKKTRQKERLVASYLQRYCLKNDSIGFFGPVGWGWIGDGPDALRVTPGPQLLARREVYFEGWGIDALARTLEERLELRPWLAPQLMPYARVEGRLLYVAARPPLVLGAAEAALLRACDGRRTAREIVAAALAAPTDSGFSDGGAVLAALERFRRRGVVRWTLEGPMELHPERRLRARLQGVGDEKARARALGALDELEAARDAVAAAAGRCDELERAMTALEQTFTRLTSASATRAGGETYAARTLVYEDARRDLCLELGRGFLERLGPPLSLVMRAARWCCARAGSGYRAQIERVRLEILAQGAAEVPLLSLLSRARFLREGAPDDPFHAALDETRRRWLDALDLPARSGPRVELPAAALRPRVEAAFPGCAADGLWGRYISPDVMLAAADAEAVRQGDFLAVLGEVHPMHTFVISAFASQHPDREALLDALDADGARWVVPLAPKDHLGQRLNLAAAPRGSLLYEHCADSPPVTRHGVLRAADLLVESGPAGPEVRTRDGRRRFGAVDFLAFLLAWRHANHFTLMPAWAHTPRVTVDGVVLCRETWRFAPGETPFAHVEDPLERFLAARRFARAHGLPRFAFFKVPVERKPCYVDFDSPIYVDLLAKLARAGQEAGGSLTLTEMLPRADEAWLPDREGRSYTAELRLIGTDAEGE